MPSQYLTVAELLAAPTGIDWRNAVTPGATGPAGVTGQQLYEELTNVIQRASAMADTYCNQVLGATTDVEEKWTDGSSSGVDNNGYLWVHADYSPVSSVLLFLYARPQTGGTIWTVVPPGDVIVQGARRNLLVYPGAFRRGASTLRVQYTYVNGYPNTVLAAAAGEGALALPFADATGVVAGSQLTIYDEGATEAITVASTWVPVQGAASVALAAATQYAHTPIARPAPAGSEPYDVSVSALPPDVKQAIILICTVLFERRGSTALVMGRVGGVAGAARDGGHAAPEMPAEAQRLLDVYKRVV